MRVVGKVLSYVLLLLFLGNACLGLFVTQDIDATLSNGFFIAVSAYFLGFAQIESFKSEGYKFHPQSIVLMLIFILIGIGGLSENLFK